MRADSRNFSLLLDLSPLRQGVELVLQGGRLWTALQIGSLIAQSAIAEAGGHDELVERSRVYANLFETQAKPYR